MNKKSKKIIMISIILIILVISGIIIKLYNSHQEEIKKQNELIKQEKQEEENIKMDEYNFEELEKVKLVLDGLDKKIYSFENLKEFNEKFNQNIEPIKNCYYLSSENGDEPYIFGFKLYSNKYKIEYGESYFAYPKYDLPIETFCGGGGTCDDFNYRYFKII